MRRSRANLPNRCRRQIDRIAYRAFDGKQWMDREGRAATTRNTYCGNLLWQSCLTLLALKWALTEDLSLYAGVRQFDALTHEVRRQTRARVRRDETDFTYFAVGIIWCF